MTGGRKEQVKAIKAWAVVCRNGITHGTAGEMPWFKIRQSDARYDVNWLDKRPIPPKCGPHRVVKLVPESSRVAGRGK